MASPINVTGIIDGQRIGRFQWVIFGLCATLLLLDGYDSQIIGYVGPSLLRDWHIERAALGPIFSSGLLGFSLGAMGLGVLADRFGRRFALILCITWFGALSLLTVFARSAETMVVLRFLAGLGLGGGSPNVVAILAEYFPKRRRATVILFAFTGYALGAAVAGWVSASLIPAYGWTSVFWLGGLLPLAFAVLLALTLPESIRFLILANRPAAKIASILVKLDPALRLPAGTSFVVDEERATGFPVQHLFKEGRATSTLLLWLATFMNLLVLYFVLAWLPTLANSAGMPLREAMLATSMFSTGGIVGTLVLGTLMDRFGAHRVLCVAFVAAAASLAVIGAASLTFLLLATAIFIVGGCIAGGNGGTNAFAGIIYPTAIRSTGAGWALGVGRGGAFIAPLLGSLMVAWQWDLSLMLYAMAVPELIAAAAILATYWARPLPPRATAPAPAR